MPEPPGRRVVSIGAPGEFQRVISTGMRMYGRFVLLFGLRSDAETIRLGVSASGKAGTNVVRNRLKRLLREAVRREAGVLGQGFDLVLIAKASAVGHGLADITADVRGLLARMGSQSAPQGGAGPKC